MRGSGIWDLESGIWDLGSISAEQSAGPRSSLFTTGHFFIGYNAYFRTFGLQLSPHNSTHLTSLTL